MRYRAFISYSHADARWARWLHRAIEGYRVPRRLRGGRGEFGELPDRLSPVFRDREDLASAGELGPRIQAALDDSDALLVVCSPAAARSRWVDDEILRFRRTGRGQRIYCLIVDGEPKGGEHECFPPALRFALAEDGSGSVAVEPIAADVRPGRDGKALARLKLLSGLLGVDLDVLRQREVARRHRRLVGVTVLALVVMLTTSWLAVQAVIAQRAAERRQKQAEALVGFMLGDLNDRLSEVSRLDILESVNDQAMAYFKSLPTTDVTDAALEQRAKAFEKIGNVRSEQGHLAQAREAYLAAEQLSRRLAQAAPSDPARQRAWARQLGFLGTSHWHQGQMPAARERFAAAQGVLQDASRRSPRDGDLLFELVLVSNNIGHVFEAEGRLADAIRQYRLMLADSDRLLALAPDKADWLGIKGLAHNNLAKMALLGGDLDGAVAGYRADLAIAATLAARDRRNHAQTEKRVLAQGALGRTLALAGKVDEGIENLRQAWLDASRLHAMEPNSSYFTEDVALYGYQLAQLLRLRGEVDDASAKVSQSLRLLEQLTRQDPNNASWQRELAEARLEACELAGLRSDQPGAQALAGQALAALEPLLARQANDRALVLATVSARLALARHASDPGRARQLREQALAQVAAQTDGLRDPRLLALAAQARQQ